MVVAVLPIAVLPVTPTARAVPISFISIVPAPSVSSMDRALRAVLPPIAPCIATLPAAVSMVND